MKDVSSGVPQRTLLGPSLFFTFITIVDETVIFSETYLFADDLKDLSVNRYPAQIQRDTHSIENWVSLSKI